MSKITNGQLAAVLAEILTNPFSGQVDSKAEFVEFVNDLAQVVCKYCGGKIVTPVQYRPEPGSMDWGKDYQFEVEDNEDSPADGSIWNAIPVPPPEMASREVVHELVRVLRPGVVGLITQHHGLERGLVAGAAVMAGKIYLNRRCGMEVLEGCFESEGLPPVLRVSFQAPIGATAAEKDAAFLAVLAQYASVNYLAVGESATSLTEAE